VETGGFDVEFYSMLVARDNSDSVEGRGITVMLRTARSPVTLELRPDRIGLRIFGLCRIPARWACSGVVRRGDVGLVQLFGQ
jgi:hypothetical protein